MSEMLVDGGVSEVTHELDADVVCPLCGAPAELWVRGLQSAVESESIDAYRCRGCDSVVSWPLRVPDGLYDAIYRNSAHLAGYSRYARYARHCERSDKPLEYLADQEDVYWAVAEVLARHPEARSWRIVEIGSGLGYLTAALRAAGYDVTGIDISSEAIAEARARFGPHYEHQNIFDPDDGFEGAFDFAILLETIEHVPAPAAFLSAVSDLLAPGGSLLVTTPNRDAHPRDAHWRTDLPPVHLFWMTEAGVERLGANLGYRTNFVDFTDFNRTHRQTVSLSDFDSTPPAMLDPALRPCAKIPFRTRVMERARVFRPVAAAFRFIYDTARPHRARLTTRSFSLVAVMSPVRPPLPNDASTPTS